MAYENEYKCPDCSCVWFDYSEGTQDDRCPDCGTSSSPMSSVDATPDLEPPKSEPVPPPAPPKRQTTFKVYQYSVVCEVYDVVAETPEQANEKINGPHSRKSVKDVEFLYQNIEPGESEFFTRVHRYTNGGTEIEDAPSHVSHVENEKLWEKGW